MMTAADLVMEYNCSVDDIERNVRENSRRNLPWLAMTEPHDRVAVIVGGGPSVKNFAQVIAKRQLDGATVFTVNGAANWLMGETLQPCDYQIILDARLDNITFTGVQPNKSFLLASQCHPALFNELDDDPVTMFHAHTDNVENWLPAKRPAYTLIASGSTVLLAAMCIAYAMGYRNIHVYGADSSFEDNHHAYDQPQNDDDEVIEAYVAGRTFKTTTWLAAQVDQFQRVARELADGDATISVHGDGLLPWVAQQMAKGDAGEADKYRRMWEHEAYRTVSPGELMLGWIVANIPPPPACVIDFGCGTGRVTQALHDVGYNVMGFDFADNCRDAGSTFPFALWNLWEPWHEESVVFGHAGICCDVMEHIPPHRVDAVLQNIARAISGPVLFRIDSGLDNMGALIGERLHLTVEEPEWWIQKLGTYWPNVVYFGEGKYICKPT